MVAQPGTLKVESTRIEGGKIVVRLNPPMAMPGRQRRVARFL